MSDVYSYDLTCGNETISWLPGAVSTAVGGAAVTLNAVFPATFDFESKLMCEPAPATGRVLVTFTRQTTANGTAAPTVNAFNWPAMTPYAGVIADLVDCGADATGATIHMGTFNSTAAFTQANLAGIAGGGILQSLAVLNVGAANMTFTGEDGVTSIIPAGGQHVWEVDDSRDQLGTFAANATGTTARVVYTYR